MKNIFTVLLCTLAITAFAKKVTTQIKVNGDCASCEKKIEASVDVSGISYADWDKETKMLTVRYNDRKIDVDKIHSLVSEAGYATDKMAANKSAKGVCCGSQMKKKTGCCSGKSSCSKSKAKSKIQ